MALYLFFQELSINKENKNTHGILFFGGEFIEPPNIFELVCEIIIHTSFAKLVQSVYNL